MVLPLLILLKLIKLTLFVSFFLLSLLCPSTLSIGPLYPTLARSWPFLQAGGTIHRNADPPLAVGSYRGPHQRRMTTNAFPAVARFAHRKLCRNQSGTRDAE